MATLYSEQFMTMDELSNKIEYDFCKIIRALSTTVTEMTEALTQLGFMARASSDNFRILGIKVRAARKRCRKFVLRRNRSRHQEKNTIYLPHFGHFGHKSKPPCRYM